MSLSEALVAAFESLPKADERETVYCSIRGDHLRALHTALLSLRYFAQEVMQSWPMGDVDGGELQDLAIKHGLLKRQEPAPTAPCGEHCGCAEVVAADEWADGVECYRKTPLFTGAQEGKTE